VNRTKREPIHPDDIEQMCGMFGKGLTYSEIAAKVRLPYQRVYYALKRGPEMSRKRKPKPLATHRRTCRICGKSFLGHWNGVYCSPACRKVYDAERRESKMAESRARSQTAAAALRSRMPPLLDPAKWSGFSDKEIRDTRTNLYVIEALGLESIKIGVSCDPERRCYHLQTASPVPLCLVGVVESVPGRYENLLHEQFGAYRCCGEWFEKKGEVAEFVNRVTAMQLGEGKAASASRLDSSGRVYGL
jgi:hypothetical protein